MNQRYTWRDGIQNGSPDGMALVDASNSVVQFPSYQGISTATSGPANGMTSVEIGASVASSTPVGVSLQSSGTGTTYEAFTWGTSAINTFGAVNIGQISPPSLSALARWY
jgi:hypothetical protein